MQAQHHTFSALADKTALMHNQLGMLKNSYRELWRASTGSKRDPFEGGLGSLDI
jgi:nucleoporin p58/p45